MEEVISSSEGSTGPLGEGATSRRNARRRAAHVALGIVALVSFALLRLPYLSLPLERDEGEYAFIAQRILEGDVPYRDAFDQKPPGVFVAYLAAFALFGQTIEGIHGLAELWTVLTVFAFWILMRQLADELSAGFAVLVLAITTTDPHILATAANTEIFMLLPIVASTYALVRGLRRGGAGWWIGCGALVAAACWFKQVAAVHALFVAAVVVADRARRPASLRWFGVLRIFGLLSLGALLTSLPLIAYFAATGAWDPFVDAVLLHNLVYSQRLPLAQGLDQLSFWLRRQAPSFGVLWTLALCALIAPGIARGRLRPLLAGWLLTSGAGVSVGLYFRPHYFIQLLPPLAALCGVTLGAAAHRLLALRRPAVAWAGFAALLLAVLAPPVVASWDTLWAGSPEETSRRIYGVNPFPESLRIADYIRRTSNPGDAIYVVGSEPQIFFYAQRPSATRYIFFYPLTGPFPDALERQREVMREVAAARPLYVVWVDLSTSLLLSPESERYVFRASSEMLRRDYRLEFAAHLGFEDGGRESPASRGTLQPVFDFVYGAQARRLLNEARETGDAIAWVAVYRRTS